LACAKAIKAGKRPETDGKRPRRAEGAVSGAFSQADVAIYEVLAEGEGRRSNTDLVWKRISEMRAKRFCEAD
jgi:hypothetical protein